jgi:hypothetical protein
MSVIRALTLDMVVLCDCNFTSIINHKGYAIM